MDYLLSRLLVCLHPLLNRLVCQDDLFDALIAPAFHCACSFARSFARLFTRSQQISISSYSNQNGFVSRYVRGCSCRSWVSKIEGFSWRLESPNFSLAVKIDGGEASCRQISTRRRLCIPLAYEILPSRRCLISSRRQAAEAVRTRIKKVFMAICGTVAHRPFTLWHYAPGHLDLVANWYDSKGSG